MTHAVLPLDVIEKYKAAPSVYNARPSGLASLMGGAIVLHHTAGTNSLQYLMGGHGVSTHRLIPRTGLRVYKMVSDKHRAWHAGVSEWGGRSDWNNFSLGFEIENTGTGLQAYTDTQYEVVAQMVAYDCALYRIEDKFVRHHKEIQSGKSDAKGWDNGRMWRRVDQIRAHFPAEWGFPLWFKAEGRTEA